MLGGQAHDRTPIAQENPSHEEHDRMLVWVDGSFDAEGFDINNVNRELRR